MTNVVHLKPGRDKQAAKHHPWIFSGAVAQVEGNPEPGETVAVKDAGGRFLAWGYFNPRSQISVRLLEWQEARPVDETWWREKVQAACRRRQDLAPETDAVRLVYAESDGLPGLIVDRYADFVVVQCLTAGVERVKAAVVAALNEAVQPTGIYERSNLSVREMEGLPQSAGVLAGDAPPDLIEVHENGRPYLVDVKQGQKTGFYLDQRDNRLQVAAFANGKEVLDAFAYSGAFGVTCLAHGAAGVTTLDSSGEALALARKNYERNGHDAPDDRLLCADVFETLRQFRDQQRRFDLIVLDPPKLAPNKAHLEKAEKAYKDLNMLALELLPPEGVLATFSCSGAVLPERFQTIVAWAAKDLEREVQVLHYLSQAPDHPVRLSFPQSHYLKGLICRVG